MRFPRGTRLTWQAGVLRQSSYWDLVDHAAGEGNSALPANSEKQTVEHLRPMLEEAVRSQLVSDVPVGVFLSGGIDSSALVSILSRWRSDAQYVFHCFSRSRIFRGGALTGRRSQVPHRSSRDQCVAGGCPGCHSRCPGFDGLADHGWHQYLFCLARDQASRGEGSVVGAGWRRSVCRVFFVPDRAAHGAHREVLESLAKIGTNSGCLAICCHCRRKLIKIANWRPWFATMDGCCILIS